MQATWSDCSAVKFTFVSQQSEGYSCRHDVYNTTPTILNKLTTVYNRSLDSSHEENRANHRTNRPRARLLITQAINQPLWPLSNWNDNRRGTNSPRYPNESSHRLSTPWSIIFFRSAAATTLLMTSYYYSRGVRRAKTTKQPWQVSAAGASATLSTSYSHQWPVCGL